MEPENSLWNKQNLQTGSSRSREAAFHLITIEISNHEDLLGSRTSFTICCMRFAFKRYEHAASRRVDGTETWSKWDFQTGIPTP